MSDAMPGRDGPIATRNASELTGLAGFPALCYDPPRSPSPSAASVPWKAPTD